MSSDNDNETNQTRAHLMGLSVEVLRLYLNQANLTTSGSKKALVDRMLENGIFPSDMTTDAGSGDEQGGTENEALPDNEEASSSGDPHSSCDESHSHAKSEATTTFYPMAGTVCHCSSSDHLGFETIQPPYHFQV